MIALEAQQKISGQALVCLHLTGSIALISYSRYWCRRYRKKSLRKDHVVEFMRKLHRSEFQLYCTKNASDADSNIGRFTNLKMPKLHRRTSEDSGFRAAKTLQQQRLISHLACFMR